MGIGAPPLIRSAARTAEWASATSTMDPGRQNDSMMLSAPEVSSSRPDTPPCASRHDDRSANPQCYLPIWRGGDSGSVGPLSNQGTLCREGMPASSEKCRECFWYSGLLIGRASPRLTRTARAGQLPPGRAGKPMAGHELLRDDRTQACREQGLQRCVQGADGFDVAACHRLRIRMSWPARLRFSPLRWAR